MAERTLTLRELNRATLTRQLLLERAELPVTAALERLVGMQAQLASAPFVGLWTRLKGFKRAELAELIEQRAVVKATMMRATLHLLTTTDFLRFRTTLEPVLLEAANTITKDRGEFDLRKVLKAARQYIAAEPRSFAAISEMLTALLPDVDVGAMRYSVRTHIPLVQVPIPKGWCYSNKPEFTLAETWLNASFDPEVHLRELVLRYLTAFGPASVVDMQTWLGLKLKEVFEQMRPELQSYREGRRELFDVPGLALPSADVPAPVRFLPEYDNLLLSHNNRTRIIAEEYRPRVYLPGLRVAATILVDGFVRGAWKVEKTKHTATILLELFAKVSKPEETAVREEAERLIRFIEPQAKTYEVRLAQ